MGEGASQLD